ncbi:MAG: PEP-CTERM sorting domain-containing protein, partial [Verrucomicrobiota bacterium]
WGLPLWLGLFAPQAKAVVLVGYGFGTSVTPTDAPSQQVPHITASMFTLGAGLIDGGYAGGDGGRSRRATGWNGSFPSSTDYWGFTVTVNPGHTIDLTSLGFDEAIAMGNFAEWHLRTSLDGFNSIIAGGLMTPGFGPPGPIPAEHTVDLSSITNLTGSIEFRIYNSGFGQADATTPWRIDNVRLEGNVNHIPEPSSLALITGTGLLIGLVRRRRG